MSVYWRRFVREQPDAAAETLARQAAEIAELKGFVKLAAAISNTKAPSPVELADLAAQAKKLNDGFERAR